MRCFYCGSFNFDLHLGGKSLLPKRVSFFVAGLRALPGGASFYRKKFNFTITDFIVTALTIYCNCVRAE